MWFSRADHIISSIITALPISAIAFEGYKIYLSTAEFYERYANVENVLVSDGEYFYMFGTEIAYALMIIIILLLVPKRKKQCLYYSIFRRWIFCISDSIILIIRICNVQESGAIFEQGFMRVK